MRGTRDSSANKAQAMQHSDPSGGGSSLQGRSASGSKFNQQLKKQVQASSQAHGIDPLATNKYLQNYLSEHPTSSQQGKPTVPLKVIQKVQQSLAQSSNNGGTQFKQNYASTSSQGHKQANDLDQNGKPNSKHQQTRNAPNHTGFSSRSDMINMGSSANKNGGQQASSQGQLQGPNNQGVAQLERRKDRASSSSKQRLSSQNDHQQQSQSNPNSVSRSLVRPSSKNRVSSQQPTNHTQKIYPSQTSQKMGSSQPRGQSPKIPQPSHNLKASGQHQLNMTGQNLQNYFDNQIPAFGAGSNKNLPRKKRITVQQQSQPLATEPNESTSQAQARQNSRGKLPGGNLPPMGGSYTHGQTQAQSTQGNNSASGGQRAPSPGQAAFQNKPQHPRPQSQSKDKKPGSRSQSNSNDQQQRARPTAANHEPQPFQKEELFLNVDSQYNDLIMQMIQPNRSHFNFEGSVQYVMNASELSNQALARLLYTRKNMPIPKLPESLQNQLKPKNDKGSRSRNIGDSSLHKNNAAGQSTASFFNTKKSFQAATLEQASSNNIDQGIKRAEGYHDGPDSHAMIGKDFYQTCRTEVRQGTPENIKQLMPDYQSAKYSAKRNGIVAAYGANTNQGIVRNYNEDRVAIILNIMKPKSKQFTGQEWPKCSFFGIYDGHGGHVCADFLRDYLHQFIIKDQYFPKEPIKAIKNGFKEAEKLFLEFAEGQQYEVGDIDRSGSCAIVALIIDDMCYIGNTGDSRACMSANGGKEVIGLSNDHKPTDDIEMHRILNNNGRIYQNASIVNVQQPGGLQSQIVLGPHRVFPGRLSVCRTFGDIEAKLAKLDGNVRVVVAEPDVTAFKIERGKQDFIVIGCDGIFDKLENRDCVHLIWQACLQEDIGADSLVNTNDEEQIGAQKQNKTQDERRHKLAGLAVDSILKTCAMRRSCDNITSVVIAFDNFYRKLDEVRHNVVRPGQICSNNDHEIFEEIQYHPVANTAADDNNVIYIENDEHLESINESQNNEQDDAQKTGSTTDAKLLQKSADGQLLYGETGMTGQSNSQLSAMTMQQNALGQVEGVNPNSAYGNPIITNADKILSEIAEEDSISMISDKPRRLKPSDCVTPADPMTNSFMGSLREKNAVNTHTRLQESKSIMSQEVTIKEAPITTSFNDNTAVVKPKQNPYTSSEIASGGGKKPLIGSGATTIAMKPQKSSNQAAPDSQQPDKQNIRPQSGKRSSSGQNSRLQKKNQNAIHQIFDQNVQANNKSRQQRATNFAYDASNNILGSQTMPHMTNNNQSAYGAIIGSNQTSHNTSLGANQTNLTSSSSVKMHSQSQMAQHTAVILNQSGNSQSQQVMPQLIDSQSNSHSSLYQVKKQTRRGSNQSHSRGAYGTKPTSNSQQPNSQSQSSMQQPLTSSLMPITSSTNSIQLANQKMASRQTTKSQDTAKKSKTQQPNKLTELFRQVDNSQPNNGVVTNQFVQKGSLSSNNQQVLMRTMQMNNQGAQVHNIQIKPISATKRRQVPNTQSLAQAQFHNSNGSSQQQQASSTGKISVSNILQSRPSKDKASFNQTSVLNPGQESKSSQNKLISQYLAQVNQSSGSQPSSSQQNSGNTYGGTYASRTNRTTGNTEKSPGVISRAQRAQMSYNQSLPQSKTSVGGHGSSSLSGQASRQQSSSSHGNTQFNNGSKGPSIPNAYMHPSKSKTGGDHKSRNSNNVSNHSGSSLPKWQSLNNNLVSTTKIPGSGADHHASFEFANQASTQVVKKRKSTNI